VAELAGAAASNAVTQTVKLTKSLPSAVRALANLVMPVDEESGKRRLARPRGMQLAPRTPINVAITNQRAFATRALPLAQLKQMAKAGEASLNDVVLAICAGALRRYLAEYEVKPAKPLVAGVPVSLREQGNQDMTNQVSFILVGLATNIADPVERLRAIRASAATGKKVTGQVKGVIPMDYPSLGAPWLMSGLASLYGRSRLADTLPPLANVVISNVPGPQMPLYLAGAKIATYSPVSIPAHGMALNITVQSYNGTLEFGFTACRRALPDLGDLANYVVEAAQELGTRLAETAIAAAQPAPIVTKPAARKRPRLKVLANPSTPAAAPAPRRRRAPAA
jgi:WS/DGAT/MGAT family acyltransferase